MGPIKTMWSFFVSCETLFRHFLVDNPLRKKYLSWIQLRLLYLWPTRLEAYIYICFFKKYCICLGPDFVSCTYGPLDWIHTTKRKDIRVASKKCIKKTQLDSIRHYNWVQILIEMTKTYTWCPNKSQFIFG